MKTVCKKLLCLMLVAMMLVSAIPFQASAASSDSITFTVKVGCMEEDRIIETCTTTITFTQGEVDAMKAFGADAELAADLLDQVGSAFVDQAVDGNIHSIDFGSFEAGVLKVWLKDCGGSNPGTGGNVTPGGDSEKATLTVNPNTGSGTYTVQVTVGATYMSVLEAKTPANPGAKFIGWKSSALGTTVKADDIVEGDDTVTAIWESETYFLTLDENRKGEEYVNYGVSIQYGNNVADRIAQYMPGGSKAPEREGYVFMGWKLNGKYITEKTIWELQDDATAYAEWKLESDTEDEPMGGGNATKDGKVYLQIHTNDDTKDYYKIIDITSLADDDKITRAEVEKIVKQYCTPKAGYSLKMIGLFDEDGWWWYTRDPETDGKDSVIVNRDGDDYVYVMVNNVKVAEKDPSNPKTGDAITMIVSIMATSGSALAAAYVYGKKRLF